jgi:hypothetical protein
MQTKQHPPLVLVPSASAQPFPGVSFLISVHSCLIASIQLVRPGDSSNAFILLPKVAWIALTAFSIAEKDNDSQDSVSLPSDVVTGETIA